LTFGGIFDIILALRLEGKMMKAVMFDFDGTLTSKSTNIWKSIWKELGFDTSDNSYFRKLYWQFMTKDITHQQWCDLTCDAFCEKDMKKSDLINVAKQVDLINGAEDTFKILKEKGYSLNIISGNIKNVIYNVLGDKVKYFDSINSNNLEFDEDGFLIGIKGTNYDFEGKARFISEFSAKTGVNANEIYFVGNGKNDEWAHLSGCKTICINPDDTDELNQTKWHKVIKQVNDLTQILPYVCEKSEVESSGACICKR